MVVYLLVAMKTFYGGSWPAALFGFLLLAVAYAVVPGIMLGAMLLIGMIRR